MWLKLCVFLVQNKLQQFMSVWVLPSQSQCNVVIYYDMYFFHEPCCTTKLSLGANLFVAISRFQILPKEKKAQCIQKFSKLCWIVFKTYVLCATAKCLTTNAVKEGLISYTIPCKQRSLYIFAYLTKVNKATWKHFKCKPSGCKVSITNNMHLISINNKKRRHDMQQQSYVQGEQETCSCCPRG